MMPVIPAQSWFENQPRYPLAAPPTRFWAIVALSTVGYYLVYLASFPLSRLISPSFKKLKHGDQVEWASRIVSTVNAIAAVVTMSMTIYDEPYYKDFLHTLTPQSEFGMALFTGYCVYDLVLCLVYYKQLAMGGAILLHHLMGIVSPVLFTSYQGAGSWYFLYMAWTELSTPFVNMRFHLYKMDLRNSPIYVINGLLMTIVFGIARMPMVPILARHLYDHHTQLFTELPLFMACYLWFAHFVMSSLNTYWFYLMMKGLYNAIFGSSSDAKKRPAEAKKD